MRLTVFAGLVGLVFLLMLSGCVINNTKLGLKTRADCDNAQPPLRDVAKIPCYHQAAVSLAYIENDDAANDLCGAIMSDIGAAHQSDDVYKKAETEVNLCYFDIAKVIARQDNQLQFALNVCDNMKQDDYKTILKGSDATKKLCIDEVNSLAKIKPATYYAQPDNMCTVVFLLPLLALAAFALKK